MFIDPEDAELADMVMPAGIHAADKVDGDVTFCDAPEFMKAAVRRNTCSALAVNVPTATTNMSPADTACRRPAPASRAQV